jgi:hypothetical protein
MQMPTPLLAYSFSVSPFYLVPMACISSIVMPPERTRRALACWPCHRVRAPSTAAPSLLATTVVYVIPKARKAVKAGR